MEAGYCNRKKTDGICEGVCDSEVRPRSGLALHPDRSVPFSTNARVDSLPCGSPGPPGEPRGRGGGCIFVFHAAQTRFLLHAEPLSCLPRPFDRCNCSCSRSYFVNRSSGFLLWIGVPSRFPLPAGLHMCSLNCFRGRHLSSAAGAGGLGDAKERNWGAWMLPVALESLPPG